MLTTPREYIDSVQGPGHEWLQEFHAYMARRYPDITPVMFRQRPMFKVGESYVMFTAAKKHFSLHSLNFDLIAAAKEKIPNSGSGLGSVQVPYKDQAAKPVLKALVDEVVRVNRLPRPPPVDAMPAMSREEQMAHVFRGGWAPWRGLYERLLQDARAALPAFTEYFPAENILWKHGATFAQVTAKTTGLALGLYAGRLREEWRPVKTRRLSANRVEHVVALVDEGGIGELLPWLRESYDLTGKR